MAIFLEQWVHDQIKYRLRQYRKKRLAYNDIIEYTGLIDQNDYLTVLDNLKVKYNMP